MEITKGLPLIAPTYLRMASPSWPRAERACAWETADGHMLWGRNFDYNRLAQGTRVTYMPKGSGFCTCCGQDGAPLEAARCESLYSCAGAGILLPDTAPALYEGMKQPVGSWAASSTTGNSPTLTGIPFPPSSCAACLPCHLPAGHCAPPWRRPPASFGSKSGLQASAARRCSPPVHWMFTDAGGESIVVEAGPGRRPPLPPGPWASSPTAQLSLAEAEPSQLLPPEGRGLWRPGQSGKSTSPSASPAQAP